MTIVSKGRWPSDCQRVIATFTGVETMSDIYQNTYEMEFKNPEGKMAYIKPCAAVAINLWRRDLSRLGTLLAVITWFFCPFTEH